MSKKKNELNARLAPFYNEYIFRKLKLRSYMRRQITEARLLARFKKLFDGPESTIVAIGDFDQRKHRKHHEPVKGKRIPDAVPQGGLRRVPRGRVSYQLPLQRLRRRVQDVQGVREPATVSNRQCPAPWTSPV